MSYNEAKTRYYLIDPVLKDKGYDDYSKLKLETPAPVEAIGNKGRRRKGSGRTDYLLCVQAGNMPKALPVGILEAKREAADPLQGMQQAKVDTRTPVQNIDNIDKQGQIVAKAMSNLRDMLETSS